MFALSGASGLLGFYLCSELLSRGIPFKVLGRAPFVHRDMSSIPFCFCDLSQKLDVDSLSLFLDDVDTFIHLAAVTPYSSTHLIDYYSANAVMPKMLFDLCAPLEIGHFIYLSGSNIMKPVNGFVDNGSSYSTALRHPPYLSSKIAGELLLLNSSSSTKLSILRPSSLYGYSIRSGLFRRVYDSLSRGIPFTLASGGQWSADFIYAGDVAQVIAHLAEHSIPGVFNIGSGVASTAYDVVKNFITILELSHDLINFESVSSFDPSTSLPPVSVDHFCHLIGTLPLSLTEGLEHAFEHYGCI